MIHAQSDIFVGRNIETVSIAVFSEEIVPSLETSRSLVSAYGRIFLEGLGVVWVVEDGTGISKNTVEGNLVILLVLMSSAIGPDVVFFKGSIMDESSILIVIVSCFYICREVCKDDGRKMISGWQCSHGSNRNRSGSCSVGCCNGSREITFVVADMIKVIFIKIRMKE